MSYRLRKLRDKHLVACQLRNITISAQAIAFLHNVRRGVSAEHNHGQRMQSGLRADLREQLEPGEPWHVNVGQQERWQRRLATLASRAPQQIVHYLAAVAQPERTRPRVQLAQCNPRQFGIAVTVIHDEDVDVERMRPWARGGHAISLDPHGRTSIPLGAAAVHCERAESVSAKASGTAPDLRASTPP
jgi:hypothetical protein